MEAVAVQPAVANVKEENGLSTTTTTASSTGTTTTTTGSKSSVKKTTTKTEETLKIPTTFTKTKVDTSKTSRLYPNSGNPDGSVNDMKDLCRNLEVTLGQMVDDTREDDLFITRLQEEFITADEKWENKVTAISNDFLNMKKEMFDDKAKKEVDDLKDQIDEMRKQLNEREKDNENLKFDLRKKDEDINRLTDEIAKLKDQMKNEGAWRDKVTEQLEEIQAVKEDTNKERLDTMSKVSDEIIKFRNKRVPDVSELKDLHELVDRIHHSMGYLMVLGQQPPIMNDKVLNATNITKTETTSSVKKKNKVSLKAKRQSMQTPAEGISEAPAPAPAPVANGTPAAAPAAPADSAV